MEIADNAMAKSLYLIPGKLPLKISDCCWWERSPISLLAIDYNYFTIIVQFKIFMEVAVNLVPHVKTENPWKTFLE